MNEQVASDLTAAEIIGCALVGLPALVIVTAFVGNLAGWPIDPLGVPALVAIEAGAIGWRSRGRVHRIALDRWGSAGFAAIAGGLCAYIIWMAWPAMLPLTTSSDVANHLSLIDFIQQHRSLVYDSAISPYLVEMTNYTPGSHLLAALVATWFNTTGLYVIHPILAFFVAVKAGIVYNIALRLQPERGRSPALALAGALLLLVPYVYFLSSFTAYYFYAQVISETFAVVMLWTLVVYHQQRSDSLLLFFALCGCALWLAWPVWIAAPSAVLALLVVVQRNVSARERLRQMLVALAPVVVIALAFTLNFAGQGVLIITHAGDAPIPSVELYGKPFLVLAAFGLLMSVRRTCVLPVYGFLLALAAQATAAYVFDTLEHVVTYYLTFKTFFLILYPLTLFAVLGLESIWRFGERWWPQTARMLWPATAAVLPLIVLFAVWRRDLPAHPYSAINPQILAAGTWAKAHLPIGCIEYLADDWTSTLWLNNQVLGNPRISTRNEALESHFDVYRAAMARWPDSSTLPYAIATDIRALPTQALSRSRIIFQSGQVGVLQRNDAAACDDHTVPRDQVAIAPRGWTIAVALGTQ